jgi:hypothetical protein
VLANTFDIGLGDQFDTLANGITAMLVNGQQLNVPSVPFGGGNAAMKLTLAAVVIFQIVTLFRVHGTLRTASRDWRWLAQHIGVPLALDVTLALILLVVAPRFMNAPLSYLYFFAPDIFWLTIAVAIIPLGRDIVKGLLIARALRAARSPRTALSTT